MMKTIGGTVYCDTGGVRAKFPVAQTMKPKIRKQRRTYTGRFIHAAQNINKLRWRGTRAVTSLVSNRRGAQERSSDFNFGAAARCTILEREDRRLPLLVQLRVWSYGSNRRYSDAFQDSLSITPTALLPESK